MDLQDKNAVPKELSDFTERHKFSKIEHAVVLSPNGRKYSLKGWEASVNTDLVGEDALEGAIVIHNHPTTPEEGFDDSFSKQDVVSAAHMKTSLEIVVSGEHIHAMRLNENITPQKADKMYENAKQSVYGRAIDNDIPVDYIQFETMVEMAKEEGVDFIELR